MKWDLHKIQFRVNRSHADNMEALADDAIACGFGTVAGVLLQIVLCSIGLDMINYSALRQVHDQG